MIGGVVFPLGAPLSTLQVRITRCCPFSFACLFFFFLMVCVRVTHFFAFLFSIPMFFMYSH